MSSIAMVFSAFLAFAPLPDGAELVGELIHDFELFDYQRNVHTLYQYKGEPILLAFWYPGDENCENAVRALEGVYQKFKDKGLKVIAVDILARTNDAMFFFGNNELNYIFLEGIYHKALEDYKLAGVPSMFLIDVEMRVTRYFAGYDKSLGRRLETAVKLLLTPMDP